MVASHTPGSAVDRLFQLPHAEFTAARNALAGRLKKAGRLVEAAAVGSLTKPPVSAWAVNQLYWRWPKEFAALLRVGDRFRAAQQSQIAGGKADLRGSLDARRAALAVLLTRATDLLRRAGHGPTPDITRRVAVTLEGLATYGTTENAPAAGRLMDDVQPVGFEALATLVPRGGETRTHDTPSRVLRFKAPPGSRKAQQATSVAAPKDRKGDRARREEIERAARKADAKKALRTAEGALRTAQRAAGRSRAALKKAAARAKKSERARALAEKRFEAADEAARKASEDAHRVARDAEEAAQAVIVAEQAIVRAERTLGDARRIR